jgi:putative FmdB family regulatory protein
MPTYQYACTDAACGNEFELVQSFTDPAASECPVCNGPVRKVFSAVGVVFKGSGFYRTDSRAGSGSTGAKGSSSSKESSSESSSGSGSDSGSGSAAKSDSSSSPSSSASSSAGSSSTAKAATS